MALRRVVTPTRFSTPTMGSQLTTLRNATVLSGALARPAATTAATNPFGFTEGQLAAGFQSMNTIGRQYAEFEGEAPSSYVSEHPVFGSDAGASFRFDEQFGMLGSLVGPQARQALQTPITTRDPITGSVVGEGGAVGINVGIDWALGEKQRTFGTPEFFRKLYRDSLPSDPSMEAFGSSLVSTTPAAAKSWYDSQTTYTDRWGTPISYKDPYAAADTAIGGGFQNGVVTRVEQPGPENMGYSVNEWTGYMSADALKTHKAVYGNQYDLNNGLGDFRSARVQISTPGPAAYEQTWTAFKAGGPTTTIRGGYAVPGSPESQYTGGQRYTSSQFKKLVGNVWRKEPWEY